MGNISSYKLLLKENFHVTNAIVGDQVGSILAATERERERDIKRKKKNKKETKEEGNVATRDINGGRRGGGLSRKKRREPL